MSSGPDLDQTKEKILGAMLWFGSLRIMLDHVRVQSPFAVRR
jgi:hypothetical protein